MYEMKFIIVAASGNWNYKGGFENITQGACDMPSAKILSGLIGPLLRRKYERKKRAREVKFREINLKTEHWTIAETWKLVVQAEVHQVEVEQSSSYVKYASGQQKVVVGGIAPSNGREKRISGNRMS